MQENLLTILGNFILLEPGTLITLELQFSNNYTCSLENHDYKIRTSDVVLERVHTKTKLELLVLQKVDITFI